MAEPNEERVQRGAPIVAELLWLIRPMLCRHDLPTNLAVLIALVSDWIERHPPTERAEMLRELTRCVRDHLEIRKHGHN